jgi:hypothetical protein
MENQIESVVVAFYKKATTDILIGYHFRKIVVLEAGHQGHPLRPPIEAFSDHLPRINTFWHTQLSGRPLPKNEAPFDLIGIHALLKVRKGEVSRWVTLFRQTLEEELQESPELKKKWNEKLTLFERKFLESPVLFKPF